MLNSFLAWGIEQAMPEQRYRSFQPTKSLISNHYSLSSIFQARIKEFSGRRSSVAVFVMSRSNPPPMRLLQELMRMGRDRLSPRWMLVFGVGLVAYLLLQPVLKRNLGWDLSGLSDVASLSSPAPAKRGQVPRAAESTRPVPDLPTHGQSTTDALHRILQLGSREIFVSPAGLRYTQGSQQGHRLKHLMRHARDEPDRPGQHGVFDRSNPTEIVALVDEAYHQAISGEHTDTQHHSQRIVYTVDLRRRIGYVGGQAGGRQNHPSANSLRLVVDGHNLITAFPLRP